MSVNQDDAASAKNTVLYISPAPAIMSHPCKPLGRLSWLSQGVIVREADIYADTGCQYLIFMKDNHPVAANALSESGIQFFNQVLSKVQQQQKSQVTGSLLLTLGQILSICLYVRLAKMEHGAIF